MRACLKKDAAAALKEDAALARATPRYAALYTRDDEVAVQAHRLALELGVAPLFDPARPPPTHADLTTRSQAARVVGKNLSFPLLDCSVEGSLAAAAGAAGAAGAGGSGSGGAELTFPGFIKYALGVHATGGWGSTCFRQLSAVRDRGELERKLPFFCGKGMHSYHFLATEKQRRMFYTPFYFGLELAVEVIVHQGRTVEILYQSGQQACGERMVSLFPAYWPGIEEQRLDTGLTGRYHPGRRVHKCDALVRRVVAMLGAFNMVLGVQLMYDYRGEGSCHFIEVNPRPHDWSMLSDQGFAVRHFSSHFDYGAVGLFLALGLDPSPHLIHRVPVAARAAFASVCPLNLTGAGGYMSHDAVEKAWMAEGGCHAITSRPTPREAWEAVEKELPCQGGGAGEAAFLDVGPELKRQCRENMEEDWFWWTDKALLLGDLDALEDAEGGEDGAGVEQVKERGEGAEQGGRGTAGAGPGGRGGASMEETIRTAGEKEVLEEDPQEAVRKAEEELAEWEMMAAARAAEIARAEGEAVRLQGVGNGEAPT